MEAADAAETDPLAGVRYGYDRWSGIYDHDLNPLPALEEPLVRAAIADPKGLDVLDLGCGTGRLAVWLANSGAHVTALDFSEGMMAQARLKPGAERITFVHHDLHDSLPLQNNAFDLIVSSLVLEHIRDLARFFQEIKRTLRVGGRSLVTTVHPAMFLRGSQARFTDPESNKIVQPGSLPQTFGEIVTSILAAGLKIVAIQEQSPTAEFAANFPRAEKYVGWPMLLVLELASFQNSPPRGQRSSPVELPARSL